MPGPWGPKLPGPNPPWGPWGWSLPLFCWGPWGWGWDPWCWFPLDPPCLTSFALNCGFCATGGCAGIKGNSGLDGSSAGTPCPPCWCCCPCPPQGPCGIFPWGPNPCCPDSIPLIEGNDILI